MFNFKIQTFADIVYKQIEMCKPSIKLLYLQKEK